MSTTGLVPDTRTVSSSAPTLRTAFAVPVNPDVNTMPVCLTVPNPGNVNVPSVNAQIESLKKKTELTPAVNDAWAKVDQDLMVTYATTVAYMNRSATDFFGPKQDLSCYSFHVLGQWDFGLSCEKK